MLIVRYASTVEVEGQTVRHAQVLTTILSIIRWYKSE